MHNIPYDAVIFDLDGTLTDSQEGILCSMRFALAEMNVQVPSDEELKQYIGPPLRETFLKVADFDEQQIQQAVQHYVTHFDQEGMYCYRVFPYIRNLLAALKKQGAYLAVATSKPINRTLSLLKYYHMDRYFDRIIGEDSNDASIGKAGLIRMALPASFDKAVMVGDRKYDIEGAKANHIDSIGVRYGYALKNELETFKPTFIVESVQQLITLLCPQYQNERGFFLSMEGLDGSGKTTQMNLLVKHLQDYGYDVLQTREPGGCKISEKIRHLVLTTDNMEMAATCEALLYAAARAQHVHEVIRPAVKAGKLVLCDRFVDSSIAYQGGGRDLGVDKVADINAFAIEEMIPDATVYLRMLDSAQALKRRRDASKPDRLESQPPAFYERTRDAYETLIRENKDRYLIVDASKTVEEVAEDILQSVLKRLEEAEE